MTKARKAVLGVLSNAVQPLSAAAVYESLSQSCDQATVYRTLHFLEEHGQADSFVLHCSVHGTERYYTISEGESDHCVVHRHWFHCEICHRFIDLGHCRMEKLLAEYESSHGFSIHSHTLNLVGVCSDCRTQLETGGGR